MNCIIAPFGLRQRSHRRDVVIDPSALCQPLPHVYRHRRDDMHRLLTADQLLTELSVAGFTIHSHRAIEQKDPRKPMLMQIRAGYRLN